MPYISNRFKEAKYDELRDHLIRQDGCESREKTARRNLAAIVAELRELKSIERAIIREIRTGEVDGAVWDRQPLIAAAERAAGGRNGEAHPAPEVREQHPDGGPIRFADRFDAIKVREQIRTFEGRNGDGPRHRGPPPGSLPQIRTFEGRNGDGSATRICVGCLTAWPAKQRPACPRCEGETSLLAIAILEDLHGPPRSGYDPVTSRPGSTPTSNGHPEPAPEAPPAKRRRKEVANAG